MRDNHFKNFGRASFRFLFVYLMAVREEWQGHIGQMKLQRA